MYMQMLQVMQVHAPSPTWPPTPQRRSAGVRVCGPRWKAGWLPLLLDHPEPHLKAAIEGVQQIVQAGLAVGAELPEGHMGAVGGQLRRSAHGGIGEGVMHWLHRLRPSALIWHVPTRHPLDLQAREGGWGGVRMV